MSACFPSVLIHLEEILLALQLHIQDFQLANKRDKTSLFEKKEKRRTSSMKRISASVDLMMNEQAECELLLKHTDSILSKWKRQTSLSTEVFVMLQESIQRESIIKNKLEEEIRQKENIVHAFRDASRGMNE